MVLRTIRISLSLLSQQIPRVALLVILSLLCPADGIGAQPGNEEAPKNVLIFSSYDPASPGSTMVSEAFRATLRQDPRARTRIYQEFLDNSRMTESSYEAVMVGLLRQKYAAAQPDLIFVLGVPALKLLLRHRAELFPRIPINYCFFEESEAFAHGHGSDVTGIQAKFEYGKTLEIALALHPQIKEVFVVAGTSQQDRFLSSSASEEFRQYEDRLVFTYLTDLTMAELHQRLATLPNNSIVIYLSYFLDRDGISFSGSGAVSLLAPSTNAPIYSIAKSYLGSGIVGGSLLDFEAVGQHFGQLGLRILSGEKAENLPSPQTLSNVTMFDGRELQRWGIDEKRLPPGSIVQFKAPSFWEQYKWYIVAFFVVSILQALLIAGLLINHARRRRAERESRGLSRLAEAQRHKLDEVISNVPGVVWESRVEPDGTKFKVQFISSYIEKLLGYSVKDCLAAADFVKSFIYEEDQEQVSRDTLKAIATGKEGDTQFRWRAKDGRLLWAAAHLKPLFDENGVAVGLHGVTMDITERKQVEERFRRYFELPLIGMAITSPDRRFVEVNQKLCHMLGYPLEELTGKSWVEVTHPDDVAENTHLLEQALRGETEGYTMDKRFIHRNGQIVYASISARCVRRADRTVDHLVLVIQDITERKLAEQALSKSEEKTRDLVRAIPDLMFLQSADGDYLDYHAKDVNELLVSPETFLGKNLRDVLPPDLAQAFFSCFQRARESGEPQIHEYMLPMHGESHWYEARIIHTKEDLFLSIVRDVTERKRVEAQLVESEERFRNMADTAPVMIWVSGPENLCTYVNQQWLDFTGRRFEEELGNRWTAGIHTDDRDRCQQTFDSAFDRREPFTIEYRLRRADGQFRWVYSSGTPRLSAGGKFLGFIGSCIDVTDRKLAEETIRESQTQLAEIIGSAMDAIITISKNQHIILFNTAAEQMFGCATHQAIGRSIYHFIPERLRATAQQNGQTVASIFRKGGEPIYGLRADGEEFPLEASVSQTELNGQTFYTVILRDITERQKAETALKESETNYRTIFNGVDEAIFIHDKDTGAVLDVNQRMLDMYGVTLEEARRLSVADLSANEPPYTQRTTLEQVRKAAAGEPQLFEWRAKDKSGRVFWVEVCLRRVTLGGKDRVLATAHDITVRKQAEEAREEAFAEVSKLKSLLEAENIYLKEEIRLENHFTEIIGESAGIQQIFLKIEQVAQTDATVLILGETGTGKELVARAIHRIGLRKDKPLIKVNCATLPATLIESELFGHEKGAFTSATSRRLGRFELADGGTIFLDEIGELPLELQGKLLRVLQDGEFERLGSGKTIHVNVRILAATNRNLLQEIEKGLFREDLWYRLNVFPITVLPLRERKEDIPLLVEAFVRKFSKELGKTINAITPATMSALQDYFWPGNIRELANVIERAMINTDGTTLRLADHLATPQTAKLPFARQTLEDIERQYILRILVEAGWRIEGPKGAARILGLNPSTLRTRMAKLGIQKPVADAQVKSPTEF